MIRVRMLLAVALAWASLLSPSPHAATATDLAFADLNRPLDSELDQPSCASTLVVDAPVPGATVAGVARVTGWAIDRGEPNGSGIDAVHVYLDGPAGAGGRMLGAATLGLDRPDVDAALGRSASRPGWSFDWNVDGASAGAHTLYVYAHAACGWTSLTRMILVGITAPATITIDTPVPNATLTNGDTVTISGWAVDPAGPGTGIDQVHVYLDGEAGRGGTLLGATTSRLPRSDVANAFRHPDWTPSGYSFSWRLTGVPAGTHTLYVYAQSIVNGWRFVTVPVTVSDRGLVGDRPVLPAVSYGRGTSGYTISFPQCDSPFPNPPFPFGIVGATGGRAFFENPCLSRQWTWARQALVPASLYLNLNYPSGSRAARALTGPQGTCRDTDEACKTYNFGYNAAQYAIDYARSQGATTSMWWLDVELENTWSDNTAMNARVIQGAIDYLRGQGYSIGIYSTSYQWREIAGSFSPGFPNWIGGGITLDDAREMCSPRQAFGGGQVQLVEYLTNNFTSTYAC